MQIASLVSLLTAAIAVQASPIQKRATCTSGSWGCNANNLSVCQDSAWVTITACSATQGCRAAPYYDCGGPAGGASSTTTTTTVIVPTTSTTTTTVAKPSTTSTTTTTVAKSSSTTTTTTIAVPTTSTTTTTNKPTTSTTTTTVPVTTTTTTTVSGSGPAVGGSCTAFAQSVCDSNNKLIQCTYNSSNALVYTLLLDCNLSNTVCSASAGNCVLPPSPSPGATQVPTVSAVPAPILKAPFKVIYNDDTQYKSGNAYPQSLGVPGYANTNYNVFNLAFWLRTGVYDAAYYWAALDVNTRQTYVNAYHTAGKVVMISAFGATDMPTGADPVQVATNLANFVKANQLDGADIDWEDNAAMENGTGEAWLITFTTKLRELLPSPRYLISHAPQAPYF
ncbi:UNVERIFIED_CONTAM: hypothetical protein HDU68_003507, partial [Siphonaria sp. JEL0065]